MEAITVIQKIVSGIRESELAFDDIAYVFSQQLHALMEEQGLKQAELAKKVGVTEARISKILSGSANLTLKSIAELLVALDARIEVVLKPKNGKKWADTGTSYVSVAQQRNGDFDFDAMRNWAMVA